jgi:UDP-glucuronate 4-epimerase
VIPQLLALGHDVVGIDNFNDAYDVRLKHWRRDHLGVPVRSLDICDRAALAALFAEAPFDAVINLAARAGVPQSVKNPWAFIETNVTGTLNLLELCVAHRVPKLVLASTSSLYGDAGSGAFSESLPTDKPRSPYAASKKAAEALCHTYHHLHGLDVTVCRFFTVYGPAGRPDMSLFRFTQWINEGREVVVYGDGTQRRDFTFVGDVARGVIAALKPMGFEVINLGSDQPYVLIDMLHRIEALIGKKAQISFRPMHKADVMATWADISKARRLLSWQPQVRAEEGVATLVRWYDENRAWARDVDTSV